MSRFFSTMRTDVIVQLRNNLYTIGLGVAVLTAGFFAWLANADQLDTLVPALLLLVIGGTTFVYIGALIFFEIEQGTLQVSIVSPLTTNEYLWSKILTLTGLATLESTVMVGGALAVMWFLQPFPIPNPALLLLGIVAIGALYTLMGIVLMVRHRKFTDYLVPMAIIVSILQLPFLYFWGVFELPFFLLIPTSAPAMLVRGAFVPLETWQWVYGLGYTAFLLVGLAWWAQRAFIRYIVEKAD